MKKTLLSILLISTALFRAQDNPNEFYNAIIEEQNKVVKKSRHYVSLSVHSENDAEVDKSRKDVIRQIEKSIDAVKAVKPFKGDSKLKEEALEILKRELDAYNLDFNEAALLKKNSKATYEAMLKYYASQDKAEAKIDAAVEDFKKAQLRFADKYNFTIQENEDSKKQSEKQDLLQKYIRSIFLPYFKASCDFGTFMEAYNKGKAADMEKARQALAKSSAEGLELMKAAGGFEGDMAYVNSGIKLMEFYKKQSENELVELGKIMDHADKLTKEEADKANKIGGTLVNESNKQGTSFNNESRKLMQKHVPKE